MSSGSMFTNTKLSSGFMLTYIKTRQWFHMYKRFSGFMPIVVKNVQWLQAQWFHAYKC